MWKRFEHILFIHNRTVSFSVMNLHLLTFTVLLNLMIGFLLILLLYLIMLWNLWCLWWCCSCWDCGCCDSCLRQSDSHGDTVHHHSSFHHVFITCCFCLLGPLCHVWLSCCPCGRWRPNKQSLVLCRVFNGTVIIISPLFVGVSQLVVGFVFVKGLLPETAI